MNARGWNRYSYVGNDPLAFTDPSGFSWLSSFFHSVANFELLPQQPDRPRDRSDCHHRSARRSSECQRQRQSARRW
jgi:hypothetical protein